MADSPKIFPLGDNCVTVDFGNEISPELNSKAISLAEQLNDHPFPGFIEAVPAYSSVGVFYNLPRTRFGDQTMFEVVRDHVAQVLARIDVAPRMSTRVVEIPADFGPDSALDLGFVAQARELTRDDVIQIFLAKTYRVYMLGFLPGFAYMGDVDERIAVPRKSSPRAKVPKGSIGIAGRQTGIYPLESPGGWQIIGRTDVEMFTPRAEIPCLLRAGDEVRFVSVD